MWDSWLFQCRSGLSTLWDQVGSQPSQGGVPVALLWQSHKITLRRLRDDRWVNLKLLLLCSAVELLQNYFITISCQEELKWQKSNSILILLTQRMLKTPNIIVSHFFINGETIKYNLNALKLIEINKIFVLLFSLMFTVLTVHK